MDAESGSEAKGGLCQIVSESMLSEESGGSVSFQADESLVPGKPEWANYVKGVVKEFMVKVGCLLSFLVGVVGVLLSRRAWDSPVCSACSPDTA